MKTTRLLGSQGGLRHSLRGSGRIKKSIVQGNKFEFAEKLREKRNYILFVSGMGHETKEIEEINDFVPQAAPLDQLIEEREIIDNYQYHETKNIKKVPKIKSTTHHERLSIPIEKKTIKKFSSHTQTQPKSYAKTKTVKTTRFGKTLDVEEINPYSSFTLKTEKNKTFAPSNLYETYKPNKNSLSLNKPLRTIPTDDKNLPKFPTDTYKNNTITQTEKRINITKIGNREESPKNLPKYQPNLSKYNKPYRTDTEPNNKPIKEKLGRERPDDKKIPYRGPRPDIPRGGSAPKGGRPLDDNNLQRPEDRRRAGSRPDRPGYGPKPGEKPEDRPKYGGPRPGDRPGPYGGPHGPRPGPFGGPHGPRPGDRPGPFGGPHGPMPGDRPGPYGGPHGPRPGDRPGPYGGPHGPRPGDRPGPFGGPHGPRPEDRPGPYGGPHGPRPGDRPGPYGGPHGPRPEDRPGPYGGPHGPYGGPKPGERPGPFGGPHGPRPGDRPGPYGGPHGPYGGPKPGERPGPFGGPHGPRPGDRPGPYGGPHGPYGGPHGPRPGERPGPFGGPHGPKPGDRPGPYGGPHGPYGGPRPGDRPRSGSQPKGRNTFEKRTFPGKPGAPRPDNRTLPVKRPISQTRGGERPSDNRFKPSKKYNSLTEKFSTPGKNPNIGGVSRIRFQQTTSSSDTGNNFNYYEDRHVVKQGRVNLPVTLHQLRGEENEAPLAQKPDRNSSYTKTSQKITSNLNKSYTQSSNLNNINSQKRGADQGSRYTQQSTYKKITTTTTRGLGGRDTETRLGDRKNSGVGAYTEYKKYEQKNKTSNEVNQFNRSTDFRKDVNNVVSKYQFADDEDFVVIDCPVHGKQIVKRSKLKKLGLSFN